MIGNWNYGTGRRKSSVARVFIKKGSGAITVNGKPVEEYFGHQTSIMIVKQPLMLTNNAATFDIKVNVHGGGRSGQAGAVRHGVTRALIDYDETLKPELSNAASSPATPARSSARRSACTARAAASSSTSADATTRRGCCPRCRMPGFEAACGRQPVTAACGRPCTIEAARAAAHFIARFRRSNRRFRRASPLVAEGRGRVWRRSGDNGRVCRSDSRCRMPSCSSCRRPSD